MDWKDLYAQRKVSAEEAVSHVRSGDRVVTPNAAGAPITLIDALVARKDELKNVEIAHMVPLAKAPYAAPEMEGHFIHNSIFVGGATRATVEAGIGDYTPCFFHKVPELFDTTLPVDVALIHVSTPDEHGYCSYGITVDYEKHAAEVAKLVIAQVNENMPRTLGDCFIHVSEIDYIVECNEPILELGAPKITEIEKKIGGYCAELIHDGDTLQLGIGAIPDAVLLFLKDKKDLGIHTEMFSDGVVELVEAGVINNSKKTLHKGKSVATFLMGSKRLYDYVHNNPAVEMYPVNYVNDPVVIAKNDNLVSINSCVQIDLLGQVVSESIGPVQISGVGGQIDFIRGASMSRGGRSILAMNSTAAGGKVSKIVPFIDQWSAVTTSRNDVQYIVTEYGIAELRGHTMRDRARSLIEIAHPNFRDSLKEEFEKRFHTKY
ncbi:MAG: acetyl-CoA hydrolase/transferase C-terminal domain-containing protein [Clostridium sp.]|uniref:acetyl-CoA hydrolase/transferase family protein n=1 Tax=Clostridium sp. TaxID=1506 RepID=UPI0029109C1A|nr:acetyl-CoA hydrolase/transferase C-terminal domain-containing protein [Clostridium sp.]MDU7338100.1 acetyl-CoA hydrolase/transferase C-terminal domain-containing protein [Clostridium sp.]